MDRESIYKYYEPAVTPDSEDGDYGYWFIFCNNKVLIKSEEGSIPYFNTVAQLGVLPVSTQYLGRLRKYPCYSAEVPPDMAAPKNMEFMELRSVYSILDEDMFLLAGKAIQIVNWEKTHRYCGRCGQETESLKNERAKICPECGFTSYPRISPAAITAVLKDDKILLSHNAAFRGNMHSLIAGFVEPGESLEECIKREIWEEVGVEVKNISYFGSQPWPFPNSLMIGFTAEYESGEISVDGTEISEAGWFDVNNLPELPPKMSIARKIIDWFIKNHS